MRLAARLAGPPGRAPQTGGVTTVEVDPGTRLHAGPGGALLVGGQPLRVLRLNPAAARVVARWRDGRAAPVGPAETALAARLHSYGLAVLRRTARRIRRPTSRSSSRPATAPTPSPAAWRPPRAHRAGQGWLVVDDGSRDPAAVAAVVARHGPS